MTVDAALRAALERDLGSEVVAVAPVHGGDVAIAYQVDLADGGRAFAKTHRSPPRGFFTTEARGLAWLGGADAVSIPAVLAVSDGDDVGPARLVLEWIDVGSQRSHTEADLGRRLATLHRSGAPCFGREDRRTTGSRGLPNEPCSTWTDFYAANRLLPLARLATEGQVLPTRAVAGLEALAGRLDEVGGPEEAPARLHGDLWAGNRLVDTHGASWLIDPAAHGGHREFDLATMRLFGGFGPECFAAYDEVHPLAPGWEDRVKLHQIAPLVVHAVKFGGGYVGSAVAAIERYR